MTFMQYAIAHCYYQLLKASETRPLSLEELRLSELIMPDVNRFQAAENKPIEAPSRMPIRKRRSQTVIPRLNRKAIGGRI